MATKQDITAEELRSRVSYDATTGVFRWRESRHRTRIGVEFGSWDLYGYKTVRISDKSYKLHRLAWLYVHGVWPRGDIDHINGIRHDNRIDNLRDVPRAVNLQNQRKLRGRNTATGLMGVSLSRCGRFFLASIHVDDKKISLGSYVTAEEAHAVYLLAKRKFHPDCPIFAPAATPEMIE